MVRPLAYGPSGRERDARYPREGRSVAGDGTDPNPPVTGSFDEGQSGRRFNPGAAQESAQVLAAGVTGGVGRPKTEDGKRRIESGRIESGRSNGGRSNRGRSNRGRSN